MNNLIVLLASVIILGACGRESSRLLRQGQLPVYDFPLYLTEGAAGRVWQIDRDRNMTLVADGLNDPRGVATDRFQNVYVAEYGAGRLLKIDPDSGEMEVMHDDLQSPSVVAVDSFGEVYVAQDGNRTVTRVSDESILGTYAALPTALTFGVGDQVVLGLYDTGKVNWGWEADASGVDVANPVNASIDGVGRVYVAEGGVDNGKVYRFHQRDPGDGELLADNLTGPAGIAVDPVGNIFVVEQGAGRIVLVTFDGRKFAWVTDVEDPQYLAFTQY